MVNRRTSEPGIDNSTSPGNRRLFSRIPTNGETTPSADALQLESAGLLGPKVAPGRSARTNHQRGVCGGQQGQRIQRVRARFDRSQSHPARVRGGGPYGPWCRATTGSVTRDCAERRFKKWRGLPNRTHRGAGRPYCNGRTKIAHSAGQGCLQVSSFEIWDSSLSMKASNKTMYPSQTRREPDVSAYPARGRRSSDGWLDRWVATVADLARLKSDPSDARRRDRRADGAGRSASATTGSPTGLRATTSGSTSTRRSSPRFPSTWPLGYAPVVVAPAGQPEAVRRDRRDSWPSCSAARTCCSLPTITHIHMSVIPVLAGDGTVFLDGRAHKTIYDGAMVAAGAARQSCASATTMPQHLDELISCRRAPAGHG